MRGVYLFAARPRAFSFCQDMDIISKFWALIIWGVQNSKLTSRYLHFLPADAYFFIILLVTILRWDIIIYGYEEPSVQQHEDLKFKDFETDQSRNEADNVILLSINKHLSFPGAVYKNHLLLPFMLFDLKKNIW